MSRLIRYLLPWWPVYRVAPRLANPAYLAVYLATVNGPKWGLPARRAEPVQR